MVFEAPRSFTEFDNPFTDVRNPEWYRFTGIQGDKNGVVPFYRYVVREKGKVEVNLDSCAECHTRLMSDGTVLKGAQGNVPFGRIWAYRLSHDKHVDPKRSTKGISRLFFGAPWIQPDPTAPLSDKTMADFVEHVATIPPGVNVRQGTSALYPAQIPDLIGVEDRLYLDHTGLQQHRSIADLMRYDAINNFIEELTTYAGFRPILGKEAELPDPASVSGRVSDRELYALAMFIYSAEASAQSEPLRCTRRGGQESVRTGGLRHLPHPASLHQQHADPGSRVQRPGRGPRKIPRDEHFGRIRSVPLYQNPSRNRVLQGPVTQRGLVPRTIRAQRVHCDHRGLVRSPAPSRRLCPDRLSGLRG